MANLAERFRKAVIVQLGNRTQTWLSKESGVNQGSISSLLSGNGNPTLETVELIAKALEVTPESLIEEKKPNSPEIPGDILKELSGQSPEFYDSIRRLLETIKSLRDSLVSKKTK